MNTVPVEFWYACTMILAAILIWVIQRYFASLQSTIKEIKDNLLKLTEITQQLKFQSDEHAKDINELQRKRTR